MSEPTEPCLRDRSKVKRLMPGAYACPEGHLHIFGVEMCEAHGYAPTEENIRMLMEAARKLFTEASPGTPITETD